MVQDDYSSPKIRYVRTTQNTRTGGKRWIVVSCSYYSMTLHIIALSTIWLRGLEAYVSISFNKMMQRKRTEVVPVGYPHYRYYGYLFSAMHHTIAVV
jgi:hypothetical protein